MRNSVQGGFNALETVLVISSKWHLLRSNPESNHKRILLPPIGSNLWP